MCQISDEDFRLNTGHAIRNLYLKDGIYGTSESSKGRKE
jgi:hypothetical protein